MLHRGANDWRALLQLSRLRLVGLLLGSPGRLLFEVYDAEYNRLFKYDIAKVFDPGMKVDWMDGHRLIARNQNKVFIFDYDGINQQDLVTSIVGAPLLFDRDYTVLYGLDASTNTPGKFGLIGSELRLEGDK